MDDGGNNYGGLMGMMNDGGDNNPRMSGLLGGFFEDPRKVAQLAAFGQALAAAAAKPKNRGVALAQAMSGAISGGQAYDQQEIQKQMQDLQLKKGMEDFRKSKTINDMIAKGIGGQGAAQPSIGQDPSAMPPSDAILPSPFTNSAQSPQAAPNQYADILKIAPWLAMAEGKPMDAHSMAIKNTEGIKQDAGAYYKNPMTGEMKYIEDPTKGWGVDAKGNSTLIPKYLENNAAIKGAETASTEEAKQRVSLNQPQVYPGFGSGGAPVLATPNELRGQSFGGLPPNVAKALTEANIGFTSDGNGNIKISQGGVTPSQSRGLVEGANPVKTKVSEELNGDFVKRVFPETMNKGQTAANMLDTVQASRLALERMGTNGGWGTEGTAMGANVLVGLGVAPNVAKMYASNAQIFQSQSMSRLWDVLNAAKGMQTEGDADRAAKTFARLSNTPDANKFILDLAEATAKRDKMKSDFYRESLPIAQERGDLQLIEREWAKRAPSVWTIGGMPSWTK